MSFSKSIKLPFSNIKKLSIGALMYLIPFVSIITGFFASGYTLEVARNSMKKSYKLPEWKNFKSLFIKGFFVFIISAIYSIPLVASIFLIIGKSLYLLQGIELYDALTGIGPILFIIIVLAILTFYILPMVILFYAKNLKFSDSFKLGSIFKKSFTGRYFITFLLVALTTFVFGVINAILISLTEITLVLPLIFSAYFSMIISVIVFSAFGRTFSEIK